MKKLSELSLNILSFSQYNLITDLFFIFDSLLFLKLKIFQYTEINSIMKFFKIFKKIIYKADIFYTPQLLRFRKEPDHRTLFGGVISLLLMFTLVAAFYKKIIDTIDMTTIDSSITETHFDDPPPIQLTTLPKGPFMFGVEIWHHNLNKGNRYFDIVFYHKFYNTGQLTNQTTQYILQPCTKDHWAGHSNIIQQFDRLHMDYWMCLPKNTIFDIRGKYASVDQRTLYVAVNKCTNNSHNSRSCASQDQIDKYFLEKGNLYFTIYFLNTVINADNQSYFSYYLDDRNYIMFSNTGGQNDIIYVKDYTVRTDTSIFPVSNFQQQSGTVIDSLVLKNRYEVNKNISCYCFFQFYKAPNLIFIQRSFQKLDSVLSYIGGLFGTIAIIFYIINVYNSYSYEVALGSSLLKADRQIIDKFKKYNFLNFLTHLAYELLSLLNCKPKWNTIAKYYECRKQMVEQLDVNYLLKRMLFLERAISILFEDHQLKAIYQMSQYTVQQIKQKRRHHILSHNALLETVKKQNKSQVLLYKIMNKNNVQKIIKKRSSLEFKNRTKKKLSDQLELFSSEINEKQINFKEDEIMTEQIQIQDPKFIQAFYDISNIESDLLKVKNESCTNQLSKKIWNKLNNQVKNIIKNQDSQNIVVFSNEQHHITPKKSIKKKGCLKGHGYSSLQIKKIIHTTYKDIVGTQKQKNQELNKFQPTNNSFAVGNIQKQSNINFNKNQF